MLVGRRGLLGVICTVVKVHAHAAKSCTLQGPLRSCPDQNKESASSSGMNRQVLGCSHYGGFWAVPWLEGKLTGLIEVYCVQAAACGT